MTLVWRYKVIETRELMVDAENPIDAVRVAGEQLKAHDNGQLTADDINMRVTDISVRED